MQFLKLIAVATLIAMPVWADGVAVLKSQDTEPYRQALAGFRAACTEPVTEFDLRGSKSRAGEIIKRMLDAKPRLVVALGPLAAQAVKDEVGNIPIVFLMVSNPHRYGLEGENIAGVSLDIPMATQFAYFKALVPTLKTIGVIYDPSKTERRVNEAIQAASEAGLKLLPVAVNSQRAVPEALKKLLGEIDALWMVPDETVVTPESFQYLLAATSQNRLPYLVASDIFVEVGALAALSPDYTDVGRQGCLIAQSITSGQHTPAELDTVPPTKVNLTINLKAATKIGLAVPPEILESATRVYR